MIDTATLQEIAQHLDEQLALTALRAVGGASLNQTYRIRGRNAAYFIKTNIVARKEMMEAEFEGLQELRRADVVRVPMPLLAGASEHFSYLVMEYLQIVPADRGVHARLGHDLARLHECVHPFFGWHRDNTIGTTAQRNPRSRDWPAFFHDHRLGVQLELLAQHGRANELVVMGRELQGRLPDFFVDYLPQPALLHGDLWSGNWGALADGTPVIFDPAVYFGDAESDIAMTRLFGGFEPSFYHAYRKVHPDTEGGPLRRELYRLYHLFNHCNLFGASYFAQTERSLRCLLRRI